MRHLIPLLLLCSTPAFSSDWGDAYFQGPIQYKDDRYFFFDFRGKSAAAIFALLSQGGHDPSRAKGVSCTPDECTLVLSIGGLAMRPDEAPVPKPGDPVPPENKLTPYLDQDPLKPDDPSRIEIYFSGSYSVVAAVFDPNGLVRVTNPYGILHRVDDAEADRNRAKRVYFCKQNYPIGANDWLDEIFNVDPIVGLLYVQYDHTDFLSTYSVSDDHPVERVTVDQHELYRWRAWGQVFEFEKIDRKYGTLTRKGGSIGSPPVRLHCYTN